MLSRTLFRCSIRSQSTLAEKALITATKLSLKELGENKNALQAPNRDSTWSKSQAARKDIIATHPHRFVQKDLESQPQPYAAVELIANEPIRYVAEGNIAVCDGNKGSTLQGHPKVFINLDQAKVATCLYCGLRYAKEEFREIIES